ncbi:MAG: hypothetical protein CBB72_016545 [Muricauda sp. TMED12]|nr:MAG: hypothetical protein CBB72_016545 [Muricauda sp. TMED12]
MNTNPHATINNVEQVASNVEVSNTMSTSISRDSAGGGTASAKGSAAGDGGVNYATAFPTCIKTRCVAHLATYYPASLSCPRHNLKNGTQV